ncbi:MAG: DUF512 domain-containing protein [Clostridia bacterium]|nr:DUF512 domain-containing protein [Clostridia bacterium]
MKKIPIKNVLPGSIAEEMEIEAGDFLLSVNGEEIKDILDYKFQIFDEEIVVTIEKTNGEEWDLEIEKEDNEDLGIVFEEQLIEKPRSCANKCIFCFMDQLPKNVRDTLVFKDDDFRLSFITGNYVTLTNSGYKDLDRIIKYHLSPINISVHATDGETRKMMLNNNNADKIMDYIKYLVDHGISVNAQIVLCPGINDGKILDKTIKDLSKFFPYLQCIAIVPVGLTKYREGLYPLTTFNKNTAAVVIDQVEAWQKKFKAKVGSNVVFVADEFYVLANRRIPSYKSYEDFPQLEDGIGMLAKFKHEFDLNIKKIEETKINKTVSIVTGKLAYNFIKRLVTRLEKKVEGLKINVYSIENTFFGPLITVTGLLTGGDIVKQLKGKELGEKLILSSSMLKDDEDIFLDDMELKELEKELNIKTIITSWEGTDFIEKILHC